MITSWDNDTTLGLECEGFVVDGPRSVEEILGAPSIEYRGGVVARELCPFSCEIATPVCESTEEAVAFIEDAQNEFFGNCQVFWTPVDPTGRATEFMRNSDPEELSLTQRHGALFDALREMSDSWGRIFTQEGYFASTQVHIDVAACGLDTRARMVGMLNLHGPRIAWEVNRELGRSDESPRLATAWQGFVEPGDPYKRLWAYEHGLIRTHEDIERYYSAPRICRVDDEGVWHVDLWTLGKVDDYSNMKYIWHGARLRYWPNGSVTIEFRFCDAILPQVTGILVDKVVEVMEATYNDAPLPQISKKTWHKYLGRQE